MSTKRTHFLPTTFQQRRLLFERREQTRNVEEACQKAHIGKSTFYNWKPRFDQNGYLGLKGGKKRGRPIGSGRIAPRIRSQVLKLHEAHKDWGKQRLADEIAKANNWVPLVSPNSVRGTCEKQGTGSQMKKRVKKRFSPVTRTAGYPGQTVNVDLLFVPLSHEIDIKLPAVSGSSGHLVIEQLPEAGQEPSYPGQVLADPELSYAEAMRSFVEASAPISGPRQTTQTAEKLSRREPVRQLRQEQVDLRAKRRQLRQKRQTEDADWRKRRKELGQKRGKNGLFSCFGKFASTIFQEYGDFVRRNSIIRGYLETADGPLSAPDMTISC